jgi:2-polyprenyl-3-methyl-5-hydroxy-6-metoxy-1,4-benzoquinol methylase
MITFTHLGQHVSVNLGQTWTARPPENAYRDTATQELRDIIADIRADTPWRTAVAQRYATANPWLHQIVTSPKRDLFFRQYPPSPHARILDVGAGWGQLSLPLAQPTGRQVTALEPTPERLAFIEAAARQENVANRMHFLQADVFETEFETRFDLICCIGVLEWVPKFRAGNPRTLQIDFLRRLRSFLAPVGQLVIGIENRLGLKYLLGAPDDHIGIGNIAVYDAQLATEKYRTHSGQDLRSFTFTEAELIELLTTAGFTTSKFHAALPDYKLPEAIFPLLEANRHFATAAYIPEHDGTNGSPLAIQRELASHYRSFAQQGVAHTFVPSFFVTAS